MIKNLAVSLSSYEINADATLTVQGTIDSHSIKTGDCFKVIYSEGVTLYVNSKVEYNK